MNWELIFKLAVSVLGLGTGVVVLIAKIKESKARKVNKLEPNPKRCAEAFDRLINLEGQNKVWLTRFDAVDDSLDDIKGSIKTLTDLHLKK